LGSDFTCLQEPVMPRIPYRNLPHLAPKGLWNPKKYRRAFRALGRGSLNLLCFSCYLLFSLNTKALDPPRPRSARSKREVPSFQQLYIQSSTQTLSFLTRC
jgi:hypothetical protein